MPEDQKDDNQEVPETGRLIFALLNEANIIAQLSRGIFDTRTPNGLSLPQFSVLNHMVRLGDGQSPLALARAFQQPKTTMTHTLATLEKRHLVRMRPNPEDGRSKLVYITDAGHEAREGALRDLMPELKAITDQVEIKDVLTCLPVLQNIRAILDKARD